MTAWTTGERVSISVDGHRVWGTVRLALAGGRLLRVELETGRRIWRRA
jgi:hypothetical protein